MKHPSALSAVAERPRTARKDITSPAGCINCSICFPDHEPVAGERVAISRLCLQIMLSMEHAEIIDRA